MSRRRLDVTWKWLIVVDRRRNMYLLHRRHIGMIRYVRLIRLWGDDHSTGCTIAVVRATSAAAAGCNGNDDGEEDYCTDNSAYNRSSAPNTRRFAFVVTTFFACTTLIVVRAVVTIVSTDVI